MSPHIIFVTQLRLLLRHNFLPFHFICERLEDRLKNY